MRAYAILSGGGVKGAALAGCIAASTEADVEFEGFGGTSAGSIVALLGASGYTDPAHLQDLVVNKMDFRKFLEDGGDLLTELQVNFDSLIRGMNWWKPWQVIDKFLAAKRIHSGISNRLGLYSGDLLEEFLFEKVSHRLTQLTRKEFTFEQFAKAGGAPLKIVATDLRYRKAKVFSLERTPDFPVLYAVRASAGFPFVFRPDVSKTECLVDGGLASNLPVFLFANEHLRTRLPVFAFNLEMQNEISGEYDLNRFIRDMYATAIEAGDVLLTENIRGIEPVQVPIPPEIDAMDLNVDASMREKLFLIGKNATTARLHKYRPLVHAAEAGNDLKKRLQSFYGPPHFYEATLSAIARDVLDYSFATGIRVSIMLPTRRRNGSRIVVYDYGFSREDSAGVVIHDHDHDLELLEHAGCSGRALKEAEGMFVDDLDLARKDPQSRGLTDEQMQLMPRDRRSILSIVIPGWSGFRELEDESSFPQMPRIGVLSIDSETPLAETGWTELGNGQFGRNLVIRLRTWAFALGRLLP